MIKRYFDIFHPIFFHWVNWNYQLHRCLRTITACIENHDKFMWLEEVLKCNINKSTNLTNKYFDHSNFLSKYCESKLLLWQGPTEYTLCRLKQMQSQRRSTKKQGSEKENQISSINDGLTNVNLMIIRRSTNSFKSLLTFILKYGIYI